MTNFLNRIRAFSFFFLLACALLAMGGSVRAESDDDRMAGSQPVSKNPAPRTPAASQHDEDSGNAPEKKRAPRSSGLTTQTESIGTLSTIKEGTLGIDMWDGSERRFISWLLTELPSESRYATIQNLVRRVMLTQADTSMLKNGNDIPPGKDLLTLRIEKLSEQGDFTSAVKLYTENPGEPYHENLVHAGILAMMYDGQPSLACLEMNALKGRFNGLPAWKNMGAICAHLLSKMDTAETISLSSGASGPPESKIIQQVLEKDNFRYTVKSAKDLAELSPLEKAVLMADGRMDYSQIRKLDIKELDPFTTALLTRDKNLPADARLKLISHAVSLGIQQESDLVNYYKNQAFAFLATDKDSLNEYRNIEDGQRLAWLYQSAKASKTAVLSDVILRALILSKEYGLSALLPFSGFLKDTKPADFPDESAKTAIQLFIASGTEMPASWRQKWANLSFKGNEGLLWHAAYDARLGFSTNKSSYTPAAALDMSQLGRDREQLIRAMYEKLDKGGKLHNYTWSNAYDKEIDLTLGGCYVMPSSGLIDSLENARNDKRLGEVILLSSLALRGVPPENMSAGLLREVLSSLEAVGLTKEARELSQEIVMGLSK